MPAAFSDYVEEDFGSNYEDKTKYETIWLPKLEAYRKALSDAVKPEYSIELPKKIDQLVEERFNALKYLYDAKLLSKEELEITDLSASKLLAKIASGELTSVEAFKAYAKRATIAHQLTNCALELFVDEGLERAQYLDKYLKENGKTVGPLHGLPMSVKEHNKFRGKITHACYVSLVDNVETKHSNQLQELEDLGVIYYIRTNQPQTLMHLDSQNNFVGLSRNPHNLLLSSGGSSSGEGSLVGFGGSAIGLGSDIGGSIRAPAAYSGCHGLRPTQKRLSGTGLISGGTGQESVVGVIGPMARSIEDINLWMDAALTHGKPWLNDGNVVNIPWRKVETPAAKDLSIAVIYDDGLVRVTPPIARALKDTVAKLVAAGAKIIEFKPPRTKLAYDVVHKMYTCDGNDKQRELLSGSGEPLAKLTKWSLNYGFGDKPLTVAENRKLNVDRDSLRTEYTKFLVDNKIDFILSPVYNNVAPKSEEVYNWSYTSLFNLLDFPSMALQTGLYQDPSIDKWSAEELKYEYRNGIEEIENKNYNPEEFAGAPIAVQLSGRRYFDEEVVAASQTIVDLLEVDLYKQYQ